MSVRLFGFCVIALTSAAAAADPVWVRVAAADSSAEAKAAADFVCTGTNDELTIQKAVDACATGEKDLWLFNGLYLIDDVHSFPDGGPLTAVRLTNMHRDFVVRGQSWYECGGSKKLVNGVILRATPRFWRGAKGESVDVLRGEWTRTGCQNGSSLKLQNLAVMLPDHQHPARCVDLRRVDCVEVENLRLYGIGERIFAGEKYPYGEMGVPVPESIGLTMTDGSNYITSNYRNIVSKWFGQGIQAGGEHVVCTACGAFYCLYGWTFGNYAYSGGFNHPITLVNCCDEQCVNMPYFGTCGDRGGQFPGGQEVTMISFNLERILKRIPGGKFGDGMREKVPGQWRGNVSFTIQSNWGRPNSVDFPIWHPDGSGAGFVTCNCAQKARCTSAERRSYAPQLNQQVFDTDLNKLVICTDPVRKTWVDAMGTPVGDLLAAIPDVRIFRGDATTTYRDPAVFYEDGVFHLFFTYGKIEDGGRKYLYVAQSESRDLVHWTPPRILTPKGQDLNYSSPGNVIVDGEDRVLCFQTYPTPGATTNKVVYANDNARLFTMRTRDWKTWTRPELIKVKGDDVAVGEMGRMIDPYLLRDRDDPGLWRCFYKQNGVSFSTSRDLVHWTFVGKADAGENVCVLIDGVRYVMFHSPHNGIGVKTSEDAVRWTDAGPLLTLGQAEWPWASGRITAGAVLDCRKVPGVGKYLMFFHGSSPIDFAPASLGLAWSDDLKTWSWPSSQAGK